MANVVIKYRGLASVDLESDPVDVAADVATPALCEASEVRPLFRTKTIILVAFLLYGLALGFRLYGISYDQPQPDEHHWMARAGYALKKLRHGGWIEHNTHLGHPGIVPVHIMMGGLWVHGKLEHSKRVHAVFENRFDELMSARVAIASVSALIAPVVFVGGLSLFGPAASLLAAGLFAADPIHIFLSRQAHLDSILTLLVALTVFCFLHSESRKSLALKIFAGIFWGLAISTKPTAGFLVPGLLAWRVYQWLSRRHSSRSSLFLWSDIWALVIGHLVFISEYMRLWQVNSRYVYKFHIENAATRAVEHAAFLQGNSKFVSLIVLASFALSLSILMLNVFRRRIVSSALEYHVSMTLVLLSGTLLFVSAAPQVLENVIRFWCWAKGLTSMVHETLGGAKIEDHTNYLSRLANRLPLFVLLGACATVIVMLRQMFAPRGHRSDQLSSAFLLFASVASWILFLSFSHKRSYRYLMPVLPLLYLYSAWGLIQIFRWLDSNSSLLRRKGDVGLVSCSAFVVGLQIVLTTLWYPHFGAYSNILPHSLKDEIQAGRPIPLMGVGGALDILNHLGKKKGKAVPAVVIGDVDLLRYAASRRFGEEDRIRFLPTTDIALGDVAVIFPGFISQVSEIFGKNFADAKNIYDYEVDGTSVFQMYEVPFSNYDEPESIEIMDLSRNTGDGGTYPGTEVPGRIVEKGKDRSGYLAYGKSFRLQPGDYRLSFPLGLLPPGIAVKLAKDSEEILRVDIGSCQRLVSAKDLQSSDAHGLSNISIDCHFSAVDRAALKLYWFGDQPLFVGNLVFQKVKSSVP